VVIDRNPPEEALSGATILEPDSEVVARGCTSDTVVWWEALASLGLSGTALTTSTALIRPSDR
jgi:hypothetical protein